MKKVKKISALLLALLMLSLCVPLCAAAESESKSVSILCYNVAGLPNINYILGKPEGIDVKNHQTQLGKQLNGESYDIIAVQEDFNFHGYLAEQLTTYPFKTVHSGGVPGGDGLNVFARSAIYNETRTPWDQLYGIIEDGADEMTPKGILYTCIDLGDGIFLDLYDIHADAYGDEGSCAARRDNFRQLAEMIEARGNDRPVIVTGDFNASIHQGNADDGLYELLYVGCGLKDAWVELHNGGEYRNFDHWEETVGGGWPNYWGVWDSLEKFLYRDGGGVHIDATHFAYKGYQTDDGEEISDHKAAEGTFTFTKTADFRENTETLNVTQEDLKDSFIRKIFIFFTDLFRIFAHWDELKVYIGL
ncbi:MAG: hypothetical protein IJU56_01370 [Clostridia bacterium]|nr:hypothetical protein [Clostridia bacterium]